MHAVGLAIIDYGLDRARQERLLFALREAVREVGDPTVLGQFGGPDDVAKDYIDPLSTSLKLGPELVQTLSCIRVAPLEDDLVLLVELADKLRCGPRRVWRGVKVQLGRASALLASSATSGPEERRAGKPGAHLEEFPARETSGSRPSLLHTILHSLAEQPLVVGIVLYLPLAHWSCHDVEVVEIVAWRRRDYMVTLRHEHHISVVERQGLVEGTVFGIDPLQREAFVWTDLMVVGLLQVPLARWVICVVFVRWVARPVAVRGQDLDDQEPLRPAVLHQDRTYLPLHVARAAYLHGDVLGHYTHRVDPLIGRRRGEGNLQLRRGFYCVLGARRQIQGIRRPIEDAPSATEILRIFAPCRHVAFPRERDQAHPISPCVPAPPTARLESEHFESDVLPACGLRRNLDQGAVTVRLVVADSEQVWHAEDSFLEVSAFCLLVLRVLLAGRGHSLHLGDLGDGHVPEGVVIGYTFVAVDGDVDDRGPVNVFGVCEGSLQVLDVHCPDHVRTQALCAFGQVDGQDVAGRLLRVEADGPSLAVAVVGAEAVRAYGARERPDRGEAGVVDQDYGELVAFLDGSDDLGVHHQVRTVAAHYVDLALGGRHLHAEPAGDLIPHARVAVLDVVALRVARPPELVQIPRHGTRGADDNVLGIGERVDSPYDLALGRQRLVTQGVQPTDFPVPLPRLAGVPLPVAALYFVAGESIVQRFERRSGVTNEGETGVFAGVEAGYVYVDEACLGVLERRLGGRGEV